MEASQVTLRATTPDDIPILFDFERDPEAHWMVAFAHERTDWDAFDSHWRDLIESDDAITRTIVVNDSVAGSMLFFEYEGQPNVGYHLGRPFWGRGIATIALRLFLGELDRRPIYGRTVSDNTGSRRVLEKCGFRLVDTVRSLAHGRGIEVDELIFRLDAAG